MNPKDFLGSVAGWLAARERAPGELFCGKHRIEHTGTGSYLAIFDALAAAETGDAARLARAERVARRVIGRVAVDPAESYVAWIVHPGSRDPHNHANNAIDGGCAIDSLATLGRLHGGALPKDLLERLEWAVRSVSDTYLVVHAMPKEILAQRLWAAAALGSAFQWLGEATWKEAALAAIDRTFSQQNADGSFPYTPIGTPRSHPGSSDASEFYQSRPALFAAHALQCFGEDPAREPWGSRLRAACEFLLALRRADGRKTLLVEAKPWYWGSDDEVASHPFDAAALLLCGKALREPRYLAAAADLYRALAAHLEPDGGIVSHRGRGWSFQCRLFWNAHCAWLARTRTLLEEALAAPAAAAPAPELRWYPDAGLARYADDRLVVHIRGKRPRSNVNHGSPFGGGGLLHATARAAPGREMVGKRFGEKVVAGEWLVLPRRAPGPFARLRKAWRENREELRFSAWIARVRARSGDLPGAFSWLWDRWHRAICVASRRGASSAFGAEASAQLAERNLALRGPVADVFGDPVPGIQTIRRYVFEHGCVRVGEALVVDAPVSACWYRVPAGADDVAIDGAPARARRGLLAFGPVAPGSMLAIRYRIRAPGAPSPSTAPGQSLGSA